MTDVLSEDVKKKLMEQIPLGRLGQPEDIAQAVLFLIISRRGVHHRRGPSSGWRHGDVRRN